MLGPHKNWPRGEVFFEVKGGSRPTRIYQGGGYGEKLARRDFAQHRPPWSCGEMPEGMRSCRRSERCCRRSNHPLPHRNRKGLEWGGTSTRDKP